MAANPLHQLTIGQRHTLRALHDAGWNYAKAGERLGVPEATVRSMVSRAARRAKLDTPALLLYWLGREDERTQ